MQCIKLFSERMDVQSLSHKDSFLRLSLHLLWIPSGIWHRTGAGWELKQEVLNQMIMEAEGSCG